MAAHLSGLQEGEKEEKGCGRNDVLSGTSENEADGEDSPSAAQLVRPGPVLTMTLQ